MIISYNTQKNQGFLMVGLEENVKLTKDQKKEMKLINKKIDVLNAETVKLCQKFNVKSPSEALLLAKNDEKINEEIKTWVQDVVLKIQGDIIGLVEVFNLKYTPNYGQFLKAQEQAALKAKQAKEEIKQE